MYEKQIKKVIECVMHGMKKMLENVNCLQVGGLETDL